MYNRKLKDDIRQMVAEEIKEALRKELLQWQALNAQSQVLAQAGQSTPPMTGPYQNVTQPPFQGGSGAASGPGVQNTQGMASHATQLGMGFGGMEMPAGIQPQFGGQQAGLPAQQGQAQPGMQQNLGQGQQSQQGGQGRKQQGNLSDIFAQAQMQLSKELESNLQKLKQVIGETQQLAQKIENMLGK